jgi:EAL domain-containing protein (putative c-di-GMP-specific phosphodiesterase class I)
VRQFPIDVLKIDRSFVQDPLADSMTEGSAAASPDRDPAARRLSD